MVFKKGQAALDFLMTYGWAIALVVIIAAVLFAMGLFDTSNFVGNKATGFAGVAVNSWNINSAGAMQIRLMNQVGKRIQIDNVTAQQTGGSAVTNTTAHNVTNGGYQSYDLAAVGPSGAGVGTGYTTTVSVAYTDIESGFKYVTTGTLTGKVA
jgi:hypothetical protein